MSEKRATRVRNKYKFSKTYKFSDINYTVEGNSGDSCRVNQYSVGHYEIFGYGVPNY